MKWDTILYAMLFILPAYLANMSPVIFGKLFRKKYPIDFNKTFRGKRIFGDGKTLNGLIVGVLVGTLTGVIISLFWFEMNILLAFMLSLGALVGDIVKSFFKRQLGFARGSMFPIADQLDFIIGAFAFAAIISMFRWDYFIIAIIITPALHLLVNYIGYKLKLKNVPW